MGWQALWTALVLATVTAVGAGCGGDGGTADATDTSVASDTTAPDGDTAAPATIACCPLGNCGTKQECVAGACLPERKAAGACYYDGECASGATCEGEVLCACGADPASCAATPGTCRYPAGCCNGDGDCDAGEVCEAGQCRAQGPVGTCWRDGQCKPGEACLDVGACACGDASCSDHPGFCGTAGVCCQSDLECGSGVCVGGRCAAPATTFGANDCWSADDCAGQASCLGVQLCACTPGRSADTDCVVPSTPGACGDAATACCADNGDCPDGKLCLEGWACVTPPDRSARKDECWNDAECGVGRECEGAAPCACGASDCTAAIGHCRTLTLPCGDSAACPIGMRCARPDTGWCPDDETPPDGVCVQEIDQDHGECWSGDDCKSGQLRCGGEVVCTDPGGCDKPNAPGVCRDKLRRADCCNSHIECGDGLECRNSDASLTCPTGTGAVCLAKPILGETCWNLYDCPEGRTCQGTQICGCNGKCRWTREGHCELPKYCDVDLDCGSESICAHDTECILSPCTTAATCSIGGRCQQKIEGACWNHDECGAGQYCEGLRVCPSDTTCVAPDQPGTCTPRATLGECCTSLRGCQPGLRCVSVTQRSGCSADFSSICVPAVTLGSDCYVDNDCPTGQRCSGSIMCPCGVEDCTAPPTSGTCVVAQ